MERVALPWGETARQFTKLMLSLLSHIGKHDAKAELNRRSEACRSWPAPVFASRKY